MRVLHSIRPEPFSHRMDTSVAFVYHPLSIALLAGGTLVALATGYHFDRLPTHIPARLKNVTGAGAAIAAFLVRSSGSRIVKLKLKRCASICSLSSSGACAARLCAHSRV